jgi:hypothetical protein
MWSGTKNAPRLTAALAALVAVGSRSFAAAAQTAAPTPSATASPIATPAQPPSPAASAAPGVSPLPIGPAALVAQPVNFTIAVGGFQEVRILGATGTLTAQLSAPIAEVAIDQTTHVVRVIGRQLGEATLRLVDQVGASVDVDVRVAPPAGTIPASISLTVTGSPAGPRFLEREIEAALTREIRPTLQAGASGLYGPPPVPLQPLQPGFLTSLVMPVTLAGAENVATVVGATTVNVDNMPLQPILPTRLFFDDDPEHVNGLGTLFRGSVDAQTPTRLYYYHDDLGLPKNVAVVLTATVPGRVQLIDAGAGPDLDVMTVGHRVSTTFLHEEPQNEGIVVDVGTAPFVLRDDLLLAGELVAGAVDIRVLQGGPVTVSVVAFPAGDDLLAYLNTADLARDGHNRHGVFDLTGFGVRTIAYTVGGPDASYEYGGRNDSPPNVDPDDPGRDYGDYGVVQRITFDVNNPSTQPQIVYLYEKPLGGPVKSIFLINGQPKDMGCVRVPERYMIAEYEMPPQTQIPLTVTTMADGGSNYPLKIGITTNPPLPNTPPVNGPDGCFPKPMFSPLPTPAPSGLPSPGASPAETPSGTPVSQPSASPNVP